MNKDGNYRKWKLEVARDTLPVWTDSYTLNLIEVWKLADVQGFFLVEVPLSIYHHTLNLINPVDILCRAVTAVPHPTSAPLNYSNFSGALCIMYDLLQSR